MSDQLRYNPAAAQKLLKEKHLKKIEPDILSARDKVLEDIELYNSGGKVPANRQPLDAGFIELPGRLLSEEASDPANSLVGRIDRAAAELRDQVDHVVLLGIGGSYMGARALFEACCRPYHNDLPRAERGAPRLYFDGHNMDNDATRGLLDVLNTYCTDKNDPARRWGIVVISKSGGTLETAAAFRIFRQALVEYYGKDAPECRKLVIPVTGETGKLRDVSTRSGYETAFPIPDGVGGRFSVLTAVGLLPAALMGLDIRQLLRGAADMTERFRNDPFGNNPVLDYTAICNLFEEKQNACIRVLSTWGTRLEAVGLWYDQLLSESLGKEELGATPITVVNTRDLHSRGQQHQQGARDKLITNLVVESPSTSPLPVPAVENDRNQDDLNRLRGKTLPDLLSAAIRGTNQAYADDNRPTADIILPRLSEYAIGQVFQFFMLATVTEGRLLDINPYGQPGVEAYKQNMAKILEST
jgi:glucose-6-phosphate isomerase